MLKSDCSVAVLVKKTPFSTICIINLKYILFKIKIKKIKDVLDSAVVECFSITCLVCLKISNSSLSTQ